MTRRAAIVGTLLGLAVVPALISTAGATSTPGPATAAGAVAPWGQPSTLAANPDLDQPAAVSPSGALPHVSGHASQSGASANWAGLVDTGSGYTSVSANWAVPSVVPAQANEASGTWIGLDGASASDPSIIQAGTAQDTANGLTSYYSWYETYPNPPVYVGQVSPGDEIEASIAKVATDTWTIFISDLSSSQVSNDRVSYDGPGDSAEWIEEVPSGNPQPILADFGSAQFTNMQFTNQVATAVTSISTELVNSVGSVIAYPSTLSGNTMTVTYGQPSSSGAGSGGSGSGPTGTTGGTGSSGPYPPDNGHGYWLVGSDGGIFSFGAAQFYGSTGSLRLQRPVVGITPTADRSGYWLVAADGGIFSFGDAGFYGSIPGLGLAPAGTAGANHLNAPIVGMVPSADDGGYFMVGSDGGVFAFGDAKFEGSCPSIGGCNGAAVAVIPDASGNGYWLVTRTGSVYSFGDAPYDGEPGNTGTPVTSAVRTPDGGGYWILLGNGEVFNYGDASNYGDPTGSYNALDYPSAIFSTNDGAGYWVASTLGAISSYGDAPNEGSMAGTKLNGIIIAGTGW